MVPIHMDRSPQLSRRAGRILWSIRRRVVQRLGICSRRCRKLSRRRVPCASHLYPTGGPKQKVDRIAQPYRCSIIWDSQWHIIVLPTLIYLASSGTPNVICVVPLMGWLIVAPYPFLVVLSLVIAIIAVVEEALHRAHASLLNSKPVRFTMVWVSLSVTLNVIVTSMICFRVLRWRALTREVLTPKTSNMYTSIVTILIESAAPLSIVGIGLVITAAQNVPLLFAFGYVWSAFCVESESSRSPSMGMSKANY